MYQEALNKASSDLKGTMIYVPMGRSGDWLPADYVKEMAEAETRAAHGNCPHPDGVPVRANRIAAIHRCKICGKEY